MLPFSPVIKLPTPMHDAVGISSPIFTNFSYVALSTLSLVTMLISFLLYLTEIKDRHYICRAFFTTRQIILGLCTLFSLGILYVITIYRYRSPLSSTRKAIVTGLSNLLGVCKVHLPIPDILSLLPEVHRHTAPEKVLAEDFATLLYNWPGSRVSWLGHTHSYRSIRLNRTVVC